ncbi:hypothetical protein DL769_010823 [Monosporascus sp. CRB-8-3]|nr:hypothetical protein DL769_010823 [Monosporascus sp. CRB-8-3]
MVRKHYIFGLPEEYQEFDNGSETKKRKRDICDDGEGQNSDGYGAKKANQSASTSGPPGWGYHESVRPSEQ